MIYFSTVGTLEGLSHYNEFLTGWFELIGDLLESQNQKSNYPVFFGDFYDGKVESEKLPKLYNEISNIWEKLNGIPVDFKRIYDDSYFKLVPDLENQIKKNAKNYGEVFLLLYTNENFFYCILELLKFAIRYKSDIEIVNKIGPNGI